MSVLALPPLTPKCFILWLPQRISAESTKFRNTAFLLLYSLSPISLNNTPTTSFLTSQAEISGFSLLSLAMFFSFFYFLFLRFQLIKGNWKICGLSVECYCSRTCNASCQIDKNFTIQKQDGKWQSMATKI